MKSFFSRNNLIFWAFILIPVLLVFRNIFFGNLPTWGDAPFFYPEGLKELFSEPLTWVTRSVSFGGVNSILWISPIMFLMGILGKLLSLGSGLIIRILFYFPSIIFSISGVYLLSKYLKLSKVVQFFAVLFYLLNTYFILLVDGGQVGVTLAYSIFPFVILFGKKMLDRASVLSFFVFLTSSFILTVADPRVVFISYLALFVWQVFENWKKVPLLIISATLLIPLNFYWIYPLIKIKTDSLSLVVSSLQLSSLLNSLLLYAPHWPNNVFGKVVQPSFYFVLIPILIFGGILFKREKRILAFSLIFLVFSFLAKGTTFPFGGFYNYLINLPFGFAFRDSSKFFIPLTLFGGILIGEMVDILRTKIKIIPVFVYLYLLFLIYPSLTGKLNFILGNRKIDGSFQTIYRNLNNDGGNFKSLWFPEKHPLTFNVTDKPAVSARDLVLLKPLAFLNASNDVFNFLNSPKYVDWLKVLGVKYLFLPGDSRNINPTKEEAKDWEGILSLVEKTPGVKRLDWGIDFPAYKLDGTYSQAYSVKSLVGVIGPMLDGTIPAIYFEDGSLDPALLNGKSNDSLKLYFNGKNNNDLIMSFLQKYFVSPSDNVSSQWATYNQNQYLNAKYELLIRNYEYKDFDYGKGVSLSTNKGEIIKFKFKVPENGKYMLATRLGTIEKQNFSWILEEKTLTKGSFEYAYENKSGFEVLNVVALIPLKDFEVAQKQADVFTKHFGVVSGKDIVNQSWKDVNLSPEGTLKYKLQEKQEGYWIILSQNYNSLWNFKRGIEYFEPVPVYSMVNGFYVEPDWGDLHIEFRGQEYFRWGLWATTITILSLSIVFLFLIEKDNERKNKTDFKN
jgi:hypothetical protein